MKNATNKVNFNDDDFFSPPTDPEEEINRLNKELSHKNKEMADLHVLIDTLQTNLRSAVSAIDPDKRDNVTSVQSFKWSVNWRPKIC